MREWLNAQAAGGFVEYDADGDTYPLAPEQAFALLDPRPSRRVPADHLDARATRPAITEAFRTGRGFGWHEHDDGLFEGTERFFRPGLPGQPGQRAGCRAGGCRGRSSRAGGRVADLGCGHGASTILMAEAYPESTFVGTDYHPASIEAARERAPRRASPTACASRSRRPTSSRAAPTTS